MPSGGNTLRRPHIVTFLTQEEAEILRDKIEQDGFAFSEAPQTVFAAKSFNINVAYYESGKLLVQGQDIDSFLDRYLKILIAPKYKQPVIGTDESGKGDYFGPLVTAAVLCDWKSAEKLIELSVQDSKSLSDNSVLATAAKIRTACPHAIVTINPPRYNELWQKTRNVNTILAWAHARAIENLLSKSQADIVITDQFGQEALVRNALLEKGKKVKLIQQVRGERELPVAAASIVARAMFLIGLKKLSQQFDIELPKGASTEVEEAAKKFVENHSRAALSQVAKTHFKTTARVIKGTALCVLLFLLLASCSSQKETLARVERERLIAKYHERLTPIQRREFLSREFESPKAAESALNDYVQKNERDAQLLQRRAEKLREITQAWQAADRFIESVNSYLSERKSSEENLNRRSELDKQHLDVIAQLVNAQSTIRHTPFETSQKAELFQKNTDYRKRVEEAKQELTKK